MKKCQHNHPLIITEPYKCPDCGKITKPRKKYNTVAAMVNDLSGSRSEFARLFRAALKKKRNHLPRMSNE